jgi:hypothetical protein
MAPREVDGLGKIDIGLFSKADFRTCLSILNKLMTMISGKKRRTFQPLGALHYLSARDLQKSKPDSNVASTSPRTTLWRP